MNGPHPADEGPDPRGAGGGASLRACVPPRLPPGARIKAMHRFLLHNDDIRDAGDFGLSPGQVGLLSGWGVFSTLRVYDGVMFAFERHWERMRRDAARIRVPFPAQPEWLESRLQRLIEANQVGARPAAERHAARGDRSQSRRAL